MSGVPYEQWTFSLPLFNTTTVSMSLRRTSRRLNENTPSTTKKRSRSDVDVDECIPRKRVKITKTRKTKGKLEFFREAPIDVLLEIFSYVEPLDLLRLSRTTKDLRALLMSRESASGVWKSARLSTEPRIPPVIEGFSEPRYASLLFDVHCHSCQKTPTKFIIWELRMRLCKTCFEKEEDIVATEHELYLRVEDGHQAFILNQLVPRVKLYGSTRLHREWHERLRWESDGMQQGSDEYERWVEEKMEEMRVLVESCKPYEKWEMARKMARAEELVALRRRRFDSVVKRLKAEGWEDKLEPSGACSEALRAHRLVNQPKELTDRGWQTIKESLTEFIREFGEGDEEAVASVTCV